MATAYTVSLRAYAVPVLHALKHPSSEINGVLLSKPQGGSDETINIIDAVPFFHQWTQLSAMLEIALQQVEVYASENGLQIVGYYHANENLKDRELNGTATRIADRIHVNTGRKSVVFLVDNQKLDWESNEPVLLPFIHTQNQWQPVKSSFTAGSVFQFEEADTMAKVSSLVVQKQFENLVDFDNSLSDVTADWLRNGGVAL